MRRGSRGSSLITMLDQSPAATWRTCTGSGLLDQICRPEVILNLDREIFARAAHRDYVRRRLAAGADPAGDPALAAWGDLSEDLRESNRAQVADIPAKLDAIGYESRRPTTGAPPTCSGSLRNRSKTLPPHGA